MIYFKYIVWEGILMLCVIAKIDPKSKARFLKLQEKIEKLGISVKALHGHITLVSYIGEDEAAFIASCKEILSSCKVFPVCYDKIEVLASSCIVVASPRKEGVLEAVQRKIAEKWRKTCPTTCRQMCGIRTQHFCRICRQTLGKSRGIWKKTLSRFVARCRRSSSPAWRKLGIRLWIP